VDSCVIIRDNSQPVELIKVYKDNSKIRHYSVRNHKGHEVGDLGVVDSHSRIDYIVLVHVQNNFNLVESEQYWSTYSRVRLFGSVLTHN